jgi:hypothetical protein
LRNVAIARAIEIKKCIKREGKLPTVPKQANLRAPLHYLRITLTIESVRRHFQSEHLASPLDSTLLFCSLNPPSKSHTDTRLPTLSNNIQTAPHNHYNGTPASNSTLLSPCNSGSTQDTRNMLTFLRRKHLNNDKPTCASPRRRRRRWAVPRLQSRSASRKSRQLARYGSVRCPLRVVEQEQEHERVRIA